MFAVSEIELQAGEDIDQSIEEPYSVDEEGGHTTEDTKQTIYDII